MCDFAAVSPPPSLIPFRARARGAIPCRAAVLRQIASAEALGRTLAPASRGPARVRVPSGREPRDRGPGLSPHRGLGSHRPRGGTQTDPNPGISQRDQRVGGNSTGLSLYLPPRGAIGLEWLRPPRREELCRVKGGAKSPRWGGGDDRLRLTHNPPGSRVNWLGGGRAHSSGMPALRRPST